MKEAQNNAAVEVEAALIARKVAKRSHLIRIMSAREFGWNNAAPHLLFWGGFSLWAIGPYFLKEFHMTAIRPMIGPLGMVMGLLGFIELLNRRLDAVVEYIQMERAEAADGSESAAKQ